MYPPRKIYQGDCKCKANYIEETKRNVVTSRGEHNNSTHGSEPSHHLKKPPESEI